jgi:UDP-2,3-diacylglucosamine hydrolase
MRETIVIADAHLNGLNNQLECFLFFLSTLQERKIDQLFILGDLFNIWLGTAKMLLPYQQPVIEALQALRNSGIQLTYIEGNRDYFLAPLYLDAPFHEIASEYTQEIIGNKQIYFSHGDLVNVNDRQYRLWRRFSRNWFLFSAFKCLPHSLAVRLVHALEQKFRETNQRNKATFPIETCKNYSEELWKRGNDVIVLGHFHEERHVEFSAGGEKKDFYLLPAWKDTYKYLWIDGKGNIAFCQFTPSLCTPYIH